MKFPSQTSIECLTDVRIIPSALREFLLYKILLYSLARYVVEIGLLKCVYHHPASLRVEAIPSLLFCNIEMIVLRRRVMCMCNKTSNISKDTRTRDVLKMFTATIKTEQCSWLSAKARIPYYKWLPIFRWGCAIMKFRNRLLIISNLLFSINRYWTIIVYFWIGNRLSSSNKP